MKNESVNWKGKVEINKWMWKFRGNGDIRFTLTGGERTSEIKSLAPRRKEVWNKKWKWNFKRESESLEEKIVIPDIPLLAGRGHEKWEGWQSGEKWKVEVEKWKYILKSKLEIDKWKWKYRGKNGNTRFTLTGRKRTPEVRRLAIRGKVKVEIEKWKYRL